MMKQLGPLDHSQFAKYGDENSIATIKIPLRGDHAVVYASEQQEDQTNLGKFFVKQVL